MADQDYTLDQLDALASLPDAAILYIVSAGADYQVTVGDLRDAMTGKGATWTAPTTVNSWANQAAPQQALQYSKQGRRVWIRGAIQGGTAATIFTLPEGFRPPAAICQTVCVHDNTNAPDFGHLEISTAGVVSIEHPGNLNNHKVWLNVSFALDA